MLTITSLFDIITLLLVAKGGKKMKINMIDKTTIKFIIVGVINTVFGTAISLLFLNILHCNYWVSSAADYVLGSILSYFLNKHFTFQNKTKGLGPVIRFIINILVCYLIAYGIAQPLVTFALSSLSKTLKDNIALLTGKCLFIVLNYFGQRFFAFKETAEQKETTEQ